MSCLDRFLVSLNWEELFENTLQTKLRKPVSDHWPILLSTEDEDVENNNRKDQRLWNYAVNLQTAGKNLEELPRLREGEERRIFAIDVHRDLIRR